MVYIWARYKKLITAALIILLLICGIIYKNTVYDTQIVLSDETEEIQNNQELQVKEDEENAEITVYVSGSVRNITNVTLPKDSRVADAIELAGGVTENADLNGINMAQKLSDEDMVYVPKKGETIEAGGKSSYAVKPQAKAGKVNINKAGVEELDKLPGVGPSIAQKIIEYRGSSGGFKSVEELNNVSGIGDAKYKDIKDLVTVD